MSFRFRPEVRNLVLADIIDTRCLPRDRREGRVWLWVRRDRDKVRVSLLVASHVLMEAQLAGSVKEEELYIDLGNTPACGSS